MQYTLLLVKQNNVCSRHLVESNVMYRAEVRILDNSIDTVEMVVWRRCCKEALQTARKRRIVRKWKLRARRNTGRTGTDTVVVKRQLEDKAACRDKHVWRLGCANGYHS